MTSRGSVVVVEFPYVDGSRGKNRPALIVQNDQNNKKLQNTIVAMITGNIRFATSAPTQVLVDRQSASGKTSGLHGASAIKCENLFTISQSNILQTIRRLSQELMNKVDAALVNSLELK